MKGVNFEDIGNTVSQLDPVRNKENAKKTGSFETVLSDSLNEVNKLQLQSDKAIQELAAGKETIHETMIAMEKASVSFQMMMQIRNKIIEAYQDIMKSTM